MSLYEDIKFRIWQSIHALPLWQIRLWQHMRLKRIMQHAYTNVPLYQQLWNAHNIHPSDLKKPKTLSNLPIINKSIFTDRDITDFVAQNLPSAYYNTVGYTSGSTGEPIRFVRAIYGDGSPEIERKYFNAKQWRFLLWDDVSLLDILNTIKIVELKENRANTDPLRLFITIDEFREDQEAVFQKIKTFSPHVLAGYSTLVLEFVQALAASTFSHDITIPYVIVGGQALSSSEQAFKEVLRCELYNRYSFEEFRAVAMECKYHNGFHAHSESFIFEVVDENGKPRVPGESGKILITDLFNKAMPFIRYDTGDYGKIIIDPCQCGLKTPRIVLEKPPLMHLEFGSKKIGRADINNVLGKYFNAILQYQVRKLSENTLEIVIVKGPFFNEQSMCEIENNIKNVAGNNITVRISLAKTLTRTKEGERPLFLDVTKKRKSENSSAKQL